MHRKSKLENQSRQELLQWINQLLCIELQTIEQLGSGAVYCQLLNYVHPNAIPQHKINFVAVNQYEFLSNFRLLQDAFARIGIDKPIDSPKLVKAKYQDNFEMVIWFYGYIANHLQQTDCTMSSSAKPHHYDFSFASREVIPKYFTPHRCFNDRAACSVCLDRSNQRRLLMRLRQLQVKMEMISEVIVSDQSPPEMLYLIQQIISMKGS